MSYTLRGPMSESSLTSSLSPDDQASLLRIARDAVAFGLVQRQPPQVDLSRFAGVMIEDRATFVTLKYGGDLRGCIGVLEPRRPLVQDVAENAFGAAFRDRRFNPVGEVELPMLEYHISILTPRQPLQVESEADLLSKIRPGVDGLILEEGSHRATFLPVVWETLPDPHDFLLHLKRKADWPGDYWSDGIQVWTYQTESVQ